MDFYFQLKLHSTATIYKIPHLMWREKTNSHFIFFTTCFSISSNMEGEKTIMDMSATDYIC